MIPELIIGFILGVIATVFFYKKFPKEEMNIEGCIDYLKSKGFYVKLSTWESGKQ